MLTDFELFVMTWVLGVLSFASILLNFYASIQIFGHQTSEKDTENLAICKSRLTIKWATRIRKPMAAVFVVATLAGIAISILSWVPVIEYNPEIALLRMMRFRLSSFALLLTFGSLWIYLFHLVSKEDGIEAHTSAQ